MTQDEFAQLCGVSKQLVSKYATQGALVFAAPGVVDAAATLAALEGRMAEDTRRAALAQLSGATLQDLPRPARAEAEELKRDHLALKLAREAGALVDRAAVERVAWEAVAAMVQAWDASARETAETVAAKFGLPLEHVGPLAFTLRKAANRAKAAFVVALLQVDEAQAAEIVAGPSAALAPAQDDTAA